MKEREVVNKKYNKKEKEVVNTKIQLCVTRDMTRCYHQCDAVAEYSSNANVDNHMY